jgi:hypothetical protein
MTSKTNSDQHETELDTTTTGSSLPALDGVKDERVDAALGIFSDLKSLEVTPTTSVGAHEILGTIGVRRPKKMSSSGFPTNRRTRSQRFCSKTRKRA